MSTRKVFYYLFFYCLFFSLSLTYAKSVNIIPLMVIKAPKKMNSSLSSGPKTIITRTQINMAGASTLAQALQQAGGVQMQDLAGNSSQVLLNMRGFGANASSNTLLLVNGIPITNPDLAPPDLNAIPLHEIEYIEIISGSESVLYGDQAVGGAINIITRKHAKEKVALACGTGSYNQRNCYAAINNYYGSLDYNITAATQHSDNYRDHNQYDQNRLSGRLDYAYQKNYLRFQYSLANENMQYPGALTAQQVRQNREQANNNIDFFKDWNAFFYLQQQQELNANWQLETDISRREMMGHGVLFSPFTQSRLTNYIRPQLKGTLGKTTLRNGLDFQDDHYRLNSPFGLTDNKQQKYGLFTMANLPLYSRLSFSLGARAAQQTSHLTSSTSNNNLNRALATTIGGTFQLTPEINVYLRRAGSFRFPKADENASAAQGVTDLRTQRGIAYETGMEWTQEKQVGKFGMYQLNLRDEIAFDPTQTPQQPFGSNTNLPPTVRRGLMLSDKYSLTKKLELNGQYNYVNARFQTGINAGNRIPLVSENIFRTGVNYHLTEHWNIYSEALFTGNQYAANDDANMAGKMGGYTIFNANLRYKYKQFSASLRLNNIFNKYYYFYTVYQSSLQSESFYPAPGRNITLIMSYLFL